MQPTDTFAVRMSDGVCVRAYEWGGNDKRPPVMLVHGYTSYAFWTWIESGAVSRLLDDGRRIIALDLRGHGASDRPASAQFFRARRMAQDVIEVADALGLVRYGLAGYSLGGVLGLMVTASDPRVESFALCGCVQQILREGSRGPMAPIVSAAMLGRNGVEVQDPIGDFFRQIALRRGSHLETMAMCMEGLESDPPDIAATLKGWSKPTMMIGGRRDFWMEGAERLTSMIPGAALQLVDGDHFSSLNQAAFSEALFEFFSG